MKFVVAIDGPAAAGKGTIAKAVAKHFDLPHLDTGLLYRGIGKKALAYSRTSYYPEVAKQLALDLKPSDLNPNELRTPEIAEAASKVAKITEVREVLLRFPTQLCKSRWWSSSRWKRYRNCHMSRCRY